MKPCTAGNDQTEQWESSAYTDYPQAVIVFVEILEDLLSLDSQSCICNLQVVQKAGHIVARLAYNSCVNALCPHGVPHAYVWRENENFLSANSFHDFIFSHSKVKTKNMCKFLLSSKCITAPSENNPESTKQIPSMYVC